MTRSSYKLPFIYYNFNAQKIKKLKVIKIWSRNIEIDSKLYYKQLYIYNGNKFIKCLITPEMKGHKIGEFITTRKLCIYKKKDKDKKKKKK